MINDHDYSMEYGSGKRLSSGYESDRVWVSGGMMVL